MLLGSQRDDRSVYRHVADDTNERIVAFEFHSDDGKAAWDLFAVQRRLAEHLPFGIRIVVGPAIDRRAFRL